MERKGPLRQPHRDAPRPSNNGHPRLQPDDIARPARRECHNPSPRRHQPYPQKIIRPHHNLRTNKQEIHKFIFFLATSFSINGASFSQLALKEQSAQVSNPYRNFLPSTKSAFLCSSRGTSGIGKRNRGDA